MMKPMKKSRVMFVLFIALLFGLSANISFAQLHTSTMQELVSESEMVLVGQVASINSQWGENSSYIFSDVTIRIEDFVKGESSEREVTVRQLGGEIGEVGELYSHTARFLPEEEVLVFLQRDQRGTLQVTHGEHGKFKITRDSETGRRMIDGRVPLENVTRDLRMIQRE